MRPAATDPLIGQQRQQPPFGQWIGTDCRCIDTLVFNVGLFILLRTIPAVLKAGRGDARNLDR